MQEIYEIEDCWKYVPTKYTTPQYNLNYDLPSGAFSISFYVHRTNGSINSNGYSYCHLRNNNKELLFGETGSLSSPVLLGKPIGTSSYILQEGQVNYPNNVELFIEYIFNNNTHTVNLYDGDTLLVSGTTTDSSYNPITVQSFEIGSANKLEKFKIKAL